MLAACYLVSSRLLMMVWPFYFSSHRDEGHFVASISASWNFACYVLAKFLSEFLHRVVLLVIAPIDGDQRTIRRDIVELLKQCHDGFCARAVEIDEVKLEAATTVA
jgi:hypothetical protein